MRMTVLGGSAAWPNPGQGCSSYLFSTDGTRVVVDCGPATLIELRKHVDYHTIDAIVISHCHSDHMLDLVPYRYGLRYGPNRSVRRIPLWLPPGGPAFLARLAEALGSSEGAATFWTDVFDVHEYDPRAKLDLNAMTVTFTPTQHYIDCYAMRLESRGGRRLFYSADTGSIDPLVDPARDCAVALIEATIDVHDDGPVDLRGHITPEQAGELACRARVGHLVLTHLWSERPESALLAAVRTTYGGPVTIAKPGLTIDV